MVYGITVPLNDPLAAPHPAAKQNCVETQAQAEQSHEMELGEILAASQLDSSIPQSGITPPTLL